MDKKHIGINAWLLLILLFPLAPSCFSDEAAGEIKLVYSGLHFAVPGGMTAMAVAGENHASVYLRYKEGFLAFSNVDDSEKSKSDCSIKELLQYFHQHDDSAVVRTQCSRQAREFKKLMLLGAKEHGVWAGDDASTYFIIRKDISHVFLFRGGKAIQIDSDFMEKSSLKHVLSNYVEEAKDEDSALPPYDLIAGNIHSTDMTVAVEITGVEKERSIKPDDGVGGYIVFRVAARVFMAYKGEIKKGDKIIYGVLIEAGINPPETGTKQIVSLRKKGKKLIVPDVGYAFEYSGKLNRLYVKAAGSGKAL